MSTTTDFYDALAPYYHLIFEDWNASIERQAEALHAVIRAELGGGGGTVLDLACGIGTQSLGLAALGYRVTASDISASAVRRLRDEAARRGVAIDATVADMRAAWDAHGREFDVVLCADNALPHLLTDDDILVALRQFLRCTAPGGACLVTIRDYEATPMQDARVHSHGVRQEDGARWVVFQVWDPRPPLYQISMYMVEDRGGGVAVGLDAAYQVRGPLNVVAGVGRMKMDEVTVGVLPFMLAQLVVMFVMVLFPQTVLAPLRWFY